MQCEWLRFNLWVRKFPQSSGYGNPLQYSCLENSVVRGTWRATVHGVQRVINYWMTKVLSKQFLCCCLIHTLSFKVLLSSVQSLCDPLDCSTPGFPVHYQLPALAQTHVHWVSDAIIPSHPVIPSPPAFNLSQHQGLFSMSMFFTSAGQSIGVSASASVLSMNTQDWFPLGFFSKKFYYFHANFLNY